MNKTTGFLAVRILFLCMLSWAMSLRGQTPNSYLITPDTTIMLIGESRPFRMVDQNGHAQRGVTWIISDADAFQSSGGDEVELTAKRAGDFHLTARTERAVAEGTIKVLEGTTLPTGTVKWSAGKIPGCKTTKIMPAVPSANGPDVFEQSQCEDGSYVAAYTADGVQMWRRKMSGGSPIRANESKQPIIGNRLDSRTPSVCDSIVVGTEQEKVHALISQRHLTFREGAPGEHLWTVEESNAQCKLRFDEKSIVVKKRKTLVAE
jgi:hypothetical protein